MPGRVYTVVPDTAVPCTWQASSSNKRYAAVVHTLHRSTACISKATIPGMLLLYYCTWYLRASYVPYVLKVSSAVHSTYVSLEVSRRRDGSIDPPTRLSRLHVLEHAEAAPCLAARQRPQSYSRLLPYSSRCLAVGLLLNVLPYHSRTTTQPSGLITFL